MKMSFVLALVLMMSAGTFARASSHAIPDYEAEWLDHVVRPCYIEQIRAGREAAGGAETGVSEDQLFELFVEFNKSGIQEQVRSARRLLEGKTHDQRLRLYNVAKGACMAGEG